MIILPLLGWQAVGIRSADSNIHFLNNIPARRNVNGPSPVDQSSMCLNGSNNTTNRYFAR